MTTPDDFSAYLPDGVANNVVISHNPLGEKMRNFFRMSLPILGVTVIIIQLTHLGGSYNGMDSPLWGFLLGIGLIVSPFTAVGMLLAYLLMLALLIGLPILGAIIGAHLTGKDSLGVWLGLIGGGYIGIKSVSGEFYDKLIEPLRNLAKKDEND